MKSKGYFISVTGETADARKLPYFKLKIKNSRGFHPVTLQQSAYLTLRTVLEETLNQSLPSANQPEQDRCSPLSPSLTLSS